jgi:hypothetical protein
MKDVTTAQIYPICAKFWKCKVKFKKRTPSVSRNNSSGALPDGTELAKINERKKLINAD